MGTAGAVIYSAHLKSNTTCFNCLSSHPQPTALLRIDQTKSRSLVFSNRKGLKKLSGTICSAVEDVTKKQMELGGGSLIGVAEDRAGKVDLFLKDYIENPKRGINFRLLLCACVCL